MEYLLTYIKRTLRRLGKSAIHYRRCNGELVAGSSTFYALISVFPITLLLITFCGVIIDDVGEARAYVMESVRSTFPYMAGWIFNALEEVVDMQLNASSGFNILNIIILLYAGVELMTAMIFGLNTIANEETSRDLIWEDVRSFFLGLLVTVYILTMIFLSQKSLVVRYFRFDNEWNEAILSFGLEQGLWQSLFSIFFVTLFYKIISDQKVSLRDCFYGAITFVGMFLIGKYLYGFYLDFSKPEMTDSYGNLYSLMVVVFWVFFVMTTFFYGSSVAFVAKQKNYKRSSLFRFAFPKTQTAASKK